jgi:outer membrane protein assembly factor BamB
MALKTAFAILAVFVIGSAAAAADWPQFMRDSARTGDAADESLRLPLGLVAQVKLEDMIMTSPAVVGGRVYVVDQMGTAYCIDPRAGRILWKKSPEGDKAMGSNTSSPCVIKSRVYYGTTAGNFHILNAADGKLIKTIHIGASIVASPTYANDSIYFQAIDSVIRCLKLDGSERWKWDHYKRYKEPAEITKREKKKRGHPGSYERPHYGGGETSVSGKRLVSGIGWDQVCLEDAGNAPKLIWCNRAPLGRDAGVPMAASISNGFIFTAYPGPDGAGNLLRVKLSDGSFTRKDLHRRAWAILGTPASRGSTAFYATQSRGVSARNFAGKGGWSAFTDRLDGYVPVASSPVLSGKHCVFTTLHGELVVVDLAVRGRGLAKMTPRPYRFKTPNARAITSTPAVSGGQVYFGCDDGYLYVLGSGGGRQPVKDARPELLKRRAKPRPATGKAYAWPGPYGDAGNTKFADDKAFRPPLRLRWAIRSFGVMQHHTSATEHDLVYVTPGGLVVCSEQLTGRVRWRRRLPRQSCFGAARGVLCDGGKVFVARPSSRGWPEQRKLFCLNGESGTIEWSAPIGRGGGGHGKTSPVYADGKVAFATVQGKPEKAIIQAWDVKDGKPAWKVELRITPKLAKQKLRSTAGCRLGGVMFFSAGGMTDWAPKDRYPGETVAIEARTGKVLWRSKEAFTTAYSTLTARGDRLYALTHAGPLQCLSAKDGKVLWKAKRQFHSYQHGPSLGPDFMAVKGYSGGATRLSLKDGSPQNVKLGGKGHTCSSVVLTASGVSLVATVGGLYVRESKDGKLLWLSPMGFAPRQCANPIVASGRVFVNPVNGMLYCFEPVASRK